MRNLDGFLAGTPRQDPDAGHDTVKDQGYRKYEDEAKRHPLYSGGWGPAVFPQTLCQTQMASADQILYETFQFVANARCKVCCIIFLKYILLQ